MKKSIRFRFINLRDFEMYFQLDSPGAILAKQGIEAGEIDTAIDALEYLCLANKLYAIEVRSRVVEELAPYDKAAQYLEQSATDEGANLVVRTLGKKRVAAILREVMEETRRQWRTAIEGSDLHDPSGGVPTTGASDDHSDG